MLHPIQNYALRLCLGAYRTSPSSSLCVLANEPPLYIRRRKLSILYCLKLQHLLKILHITQCSTVNLKISLKENQIKFLLYVFESNRPAGCWFRKKERLNIFNSSYSSLVVKATPYKLQYSLFHPKITPHQKYTEISSLSFVTITKISLNCTLMALRWGTKWQQQ